jgi:cytoskeletal protein CcmA (bactofilin family)
VTGDITTREAVIGGRVEGSINAADRLEVQSTSMISGDINTRAIAVIEGGTINGTVHISDARDADAPRLRDSGEHGTEDAIPHLAAAG